MFVRVPAHDGTPLVDDLRTYEGRSLSPAEAVAYIEAEEVQEEWIQLSELEYLAFWNAGKLSVDKAEIAADGQDVAIITAEVAQGVMELTFYEVETGEDIGTRMIDPATNTVTLEVLATTPGVFHIRAGEHTVTRLNEVVITCS